MRLRAIVLGALAGGLGSAATVSAMCMLGTSWRPLHALTDLPRNGLIAVEVTGPPGGGEPERRLREGWTLRSPEGDVPLVVERFDRGAEWLGVLVLRPARPPETGLTYTLTPSPGFHLTRLAHHGVSVTFTAADDHSRPRWTKLPRIVNHVDVRYGCGPERYVALAMASEDDDARQLVRVTLPGPAGPRSFLYPIAGRDVLIGRHMCEGAFDLESGLIYAASLRVVDVAGNESSEARLELGVPPPTLAPATLHELGSPRPAWPAWPRKLVQLGAAFLAGHVAVSLFLRLRRRRP